MFFDISALVHGQVGAVVCLQGVITTTFKSYEDGFDNSPANGEGFMALRSQ
jgi:hypothetical protein